jgi:hypothetical protein
MKTFLLAAAMALGLAAVTADARPIITGIPAPHHHCWPTRWNHWCHRYPIGRVVGHPIGIGPPGVHGLVIGHPVGVVAHPGGTTVPNHGFPNGIQPEQRVQH